MDPIRPAPFWQDPYVTLYQGDCLEILPKLEFEVPLCVIDPPWAISQEENEVISLKQGDIVHGWDWDRFEHGGFWAFTLAWAEAVIPHIPPGGHLIVWFDAWKITPLVKFLEERGFRCRQLLGWVKTNPAIRMRKVDFQSGLELAFWFQRQGPGTFNYELGERPNYWEAPISADGQYYHPTQKPVATIGAWIAYMTKPGDLILDPMMGAGSTLVAAKRLARRGLGIEKEKAFCTTAAQRLQELPLPMAIGLSPDSSSPLSPLQRPLGSQTPDELPPSSG